MNRWKLPEGVEYTVYVWKINDFNLNDIWEDFYSESEDHLNMKIGFLGYDNATSIRLNNSIDLVKIEE